MAGKAGFIRRRVWEPFQEFLRLEASGGLLLMASMVLAMIVANSPLSGLYEKLLDLPVALQFGPLKLHKPLLLWINDGLMSLFFLLVGLELKREVVEGHLSSLKKASLPAYAALGGMMVPALLYMSLNWGDVQAMRGWAIPTATDIAFALGVLQLLGRRILPALKAFLLSVAIFDDLGAILIIALFYTSKLSLTALGVALGCVLVLFLLNRSGVSRAAPYFLVGIPLWVAMLKSGVHATLAGVVLALLIPMQKGQGATSHAPASLLHSLEHTLHPWVAFGVLPIFGFANAGVSLDQFAPRDLLHPVPLGIILGLFLGKQIGVFGASLLAVKLGIAELPQGIRWRHLYGAALLCGIGFTMSLFIASLAFEAEGGPYLGMERLGILIGSLFSGTLGYAFLRFTLGTPEAAER